MSGEQIASAVAAVLIAGLALRRRQRMKGEHFWLSLAAAAALGIHASGILHLLPDPKQIIEDVAKALGPWTYAVVALFAYLETAAFVGIVAPGETIVLAAGVIAGQGEIDLLPLIGVVWVSAMAGDTTSFFIGRRLGRKFMLRHGPRLRITEERLDQVESYFDRHGGKTILIGRFIGLVRALAPFIAGSSGMAYRRFLPYSTIGCGAWSAAFCVLGYIFWRSFDQVAAIAGHALFGFSLTVAIVGGIVYAYRRLRDPAERRWLAEWFESRPALRPLLVIGRPVARVAGPRIRFVRDRLTPGELGLELTTALAVAGVGLYVFVLYTVMLAGHHGPRPLDNDLFRIASDLRDGTVVDLAKLITSLGSFPTVATLVVATSVLLVVRRRPLELWFLVGGAVLTWIGVQLAKAGVDRPRPEDPLVDTQGSSFPSAHAAYSTIWVAVALVLQRRLGLARSAAVVVGALVLAVVIGLTRVYLRAHYFSDVAGGWGLGFGSFGALAAAVLIVGYIRHDEAPE